MPIFKSSKSNKSQASIDRLVPHSRDSSPTQPEAPAPHPAQAYSGAQQYDTARPQHPPDQRQFQGNDFDQPQTHPAHILTRSPSHRQSTGPDAFGNRPSVNVIAPLSPNPNTTTIPEQQESYPAPPQAQLQPVPPEKEHKKSKRSIFGLHSSKDKEAAAAQALPKRSNSVRTSTVLRKITINPPLEGQQQLPQQPAPGQQYPVDPARGSAYLQNQENAQSVRDQFDPQDLDDPSAQYEQYYLRESQYNSPQTPTSHQSPEYAEDQPEYSPQQQQYQSFHPPPPNNPDSYEAYTAHPPQPGGGNYEAYQQLRPPSQQSLGPPSPTLHPSQAGDSRPSTATNLSRYSAQSLVAPQPQQGMPRGEPPNGGSRQQIGQQRDPRDDQEHAQYSGQQDPRARMSQQVPAQGRASPAPRNRDDGSSLDYGQLLMEHQALQAKYSKVKRYYFDQQAQVTQLQNTVANQRLSMSRTSLDDAQYATRFERLNGAINQYAFSIRKDWKKIPGWLKGSCNQDAPKIGTKEMTAIGRAYISRWLYESVFEKHFHPGLDMGLSLQLKRIEKNIRRAGQFAFMTDEQRDDLTTKITTWRLTTVEGLQDDLAVGQDRMVYLTKYLSDELTASLMSNLTDPPPVGIDSGVQMIIELAVGILQNLPIESRDVCVEYFLPGSMINDTYMKMESGMTALTNPGSLDDADADEEAESNADTEGTSARDAQSIENEIREASAKATAIRQGSGSDAGSAGSKSDAGKSKKSSGFLGGLVSKKPAPPTSASAGSGITVKDAAAADRESLESNEGKVRFAAFLAVEVRGKGGKDGGGNVLYKAPCYGFN